MQALKSRRMLDMAAALWLALACAGVGEPALAGEADVTGRAPQAEESAGAPATEGGIVQEWLESRPELEKDPNACVMCAGFGGAIVCGLGCDATGLTIRKPDGYENAWCGRCASGEWVK